MKTCQLLLGIVTLGAPLVLGQTPVGSTPQVNTTVGLAFEGMNITAGTLVPQAIADAGQPTVSLSKCHTGTYIFTLVDLDIPFSALPNTTDFASLVPGLGANRTTRLHWWEQDVKRSCNGTLQNLTAPIAAYQGPMPPAGDEPHDYVLYLFNQPCNWTRPATNYSDSASMVRMNFSVTALAERVGEPIAANYFRVQNANNTSAAGKRRF